MGDVANFPPPSPQPSGGDPPGGIVELLRRDLVELDRKKELAQAELDRFVPRSAETILLRDALAEDEPALKWVMEDLFPLGGICVLSAPGGTGKSTLLVQLLAHLAVGRSVLDARVSEKRPALFLQCEGSRRIFKDRVHVAVKHLGYDPATIDFRLTTREFIPPPFSSADFERLVVGSKAQVIVCDTVGFFFDGDENSNSDVKKGVFRPLAKIARKNEVSFFLVHHYGKPSELRQGRHKTRGASAWIDDADLAVRLEQAEGGTKCDLLLHFDKIRSGPDREPLPFHYEPSYAVFTERRAADVSAEIEAAQEATRAKATAKVQDAVYIEIRRNQEKGVTKAQLRDMVDARPASVISAVDALYQAKRIYNEPRSGKGGGVVWKVF